MIEVLSCRAGGPETPPHSGFKDQDLGNFSVFPKGAERRPRGLGDPFTHVQKRFKIRMLSPMEGKPESCSWQSDRRIKGISQRAAIGRTGRKCSGHMV